METNKKFRTSSICIRVKDDVPDQLQNIADYCNMTQNWISNRILERYLKQFNEASASKRKKMVSDLMFTD